MNKIIKIMRRMTLLFLMTILLIACQNQGNTVLKVKLRELAKTEDSLDCKVASFDKKLEMIGIEEKKKCGDFAYAEKIKDYVYFSFGLTYTMGDKIINTEEISGSKMGGYVASILSNEKYLIGIEIMSTPLTEDIYSGSVSRIVNLETMEHISVDGLLFNGGIIQDDYAYIPTFDDIGNFYISIINLEVMEETRLILPNNEAPWLYKVGNEIYVADTVQNTAYKITTGKMEEAPDQYVDTIGLLAQETRVMVYNNLSETSEKGIDRYIISGNTKDNLGKKSIFLVEFNNSEIKVIPVNIAMDNIVLIHDTAYSNKTNLIYMLVYQVIGNETKTYITAIDLDGNLIENKEISDIWEQGWRFYGLSS